jgi:hypothetical protein
MEKQHESKFKRKKIEGSNRTRRIQRIQNILCLSMNKCLCRKSLAKSFLDCFILSNPFRQMVASLSWRWLGRHKSKSLGEDLIDYNGGLFWAYWYLRGFPSRVNMPSLTRSISACATAVRS